MKKYILLALLVISSSIYAKDQDSSTGNDYYVFMMTTRSQSDIEPQDWHKAVLLATALSTRCKRSSKEEVSRETRLADQQDALEVMHDIYAMFPSHSRFSVDCEEAEEQPELTDPIPNSLNVGITCRAKGKCCSRPEIKEHMDRLRVLSEQEDQQPMLDYLQTLHDTFEHMANSSRVHVIYQDSN